MNIYSSKMFKRNKHKENLVHQKIAPNIQGDNKNLLSPVVFFLDQPV